MERRLDESGLDHPERVTEEPPSRDPGFDEDRLYEVVAQAVEDAVISAIWTVIMVGIAVALVWVGIAVVVANPTPLGLIFGAITILAGFYVAGTRLDVIAPVRSWWPQRPT